MKPRAKTQPLTVNKSTPQPGDGLLTNQLQEISFTINGPGGPATRHESMEGRNYLVVPMVMLTEGVHAGSNGPLYYPKDELAKTPVVWNHKPIVVYHPTMNGQAVSACQPAVITKRKVGLIMNTRYESGRAGKPARITAEAWLEPDRLKLVDNRIMAAISRGEMVEVSTGLFTDNEKVDGQWKREAYGHVARNYKPDHLAILPDEKGACSIADGAGLLRNSAGAAMDRDEIVEALIANADTGWTEDHREFLEADCPDEELGIIATNAGITRRDGQDRIDSGEDSANKDITPGKTALKAKKAPNLSPDISTGGDGKGGGTRSASDEADDEDQQSDEGGQPPFSKGKVITKTQAKEKTTMNQRQTTPTTTEEYIANAPDGIRDVLEAGLHAHESRKQELIDTITANKACRFKPEYLAGKPLIELEALADLAKPAAPVANDAPRRGFGIVSRPTPNYGGMGDGNQAAPVANATAPKLKGLALPKYDFTKRRNTAESAA